MNFREYLAEGEAFDSVKKLFRNAKYALTKLAGEDSLAQELGDKTSDLVGKILKLAAKDPAITEIFLKADNLDQAADILKSYLKDKYPDVLQADDMVLFSKDRPAAGRPFASAVKTVAQKLKLE